MGAQKLAGVIINEGKIASLISQLGLEHLPNEKKQQIIDSAVNTILLRVSNRLSDYFSDEELQAVEQFKDETPEGHEIILKFVLSKVPNLDQIVSEEIDSYTEEFQFMQDSVNTILDQKLGLKK